ncbi:MAG: helix-turn-helix domain-containing protein [Acidimicrobiia bacterium]|nr:helix-turn-helix domain-containing protein [Acidimicrobiia bacterium]
MASETAEVLLHPIRLRIVLAMVGSEMTTSDLQERLPDVAPATLYRQVATLADAGLIEVIGEQQKRGGVERTYRVVEAAAAIGAEDAASMTNEQHMTAFVTFVGAMIQSFGRYLENGASDPSRDGVGYRQAGLWLTPNELEQMVADLGAALAPYLEMKPGSGRSRTLLNTILIPDAGSAKGQSASS